MYYLVNPKNTFDTIIANVFGVVLNNYRHCSASLFSKQVQNKLIHIFLFELFCGKILSLLNEEDSIYG